MRRPSQFFLLFTMTSVRALARLPRRSLIIRLGLTAADQYVHRLGRTARACQEGHGLIVLAPLESRFLQTLTHTLSIVPLALPAGSAVAALTARQAPAI
jgi:superfamily II DNA/RNA helicase